MNRTMSYLTRTASALALTAAIATAASDGVTPTLDGMVQTVKIEAKGEVAAAQGTAAAILDSDAARIGFQAVLTDNLGQPLPGATVDLSFAIYAKGGVVPIESLPAKTFAMSDGMVHAQLPFSPASFNGAARELGVTVKGEAEMSPRIPLSAVPYAFRVDRVASRELDDDITLGGAGTSGSLMVYSGVASAASVELDGPAGELRVLNPNGDGKIVLHGAGQVIETRDNANLLTSLYGTDPFSGGAACLLGTATGTTGLVLDGDGTAGGGGHVVMYNMAASDAISLAASTSTVRIGSVNAGAAAGNLHLYPAGGGFSRIHLNGGDASMRLGLGGEANGSLDLWSVTGGSETIHLDGGSGLISLGDTTTETIRLDATGAGGGGSVALWNGAGTQTVEIDADEGDHAAFRLADATGTNVFSMTAGNGQLHVGASGGGADGHVHVFANSGTPSSIHLNGQDASVRVGWPGSAGGSLLAYSSSGGSPTINLNGDTGILSLNDTTRETIRLDASGAGGGGGIAMFNSAGTHTVEIDADENDHAALRLKDASGANVITMIAATGKTTTKTLTITGGADLAEPFDIRGDRDSIRPGLVVSLDPSHPGQLVVSERPYDRTVAGVISGAGGVNPGMVMSQAGTLADGSHAVALTGRVYVWADATDSPIAVGDLLTTSATAGHASKVTDHGRAQGAVIGKAMSPLREGRGLVLVLVSLQ